MSVFSRACVCAYVRAHPLPLPLSDQFLWDKRSGHTHRRVVYLASFCALLRALLRPESFTPRTLVTVRTGLCVLACGQAAPLAWCGAVPELPEDRGTLIERQNKRGECDVDTALPALTQQINDELLVQLRSYRRFMDEGHSGLTSVLSHPL